MKLIIDIDDNEYTAVKENAEKFRRRNMVVPYLYKVIESGIPLPKGHGRLIDADELIKNYGNPDIEILLENMDTIIEADKTESEEK